MEAMFVRLGVPTSDITVEQANLRHVRILSTVSASIGVICGCLLGTLSTLCHQASSYFSYHDTRKKLLFHTCLFEFKRRSFIGMTSLLFMDLDKEERKRRQDSLDTIFEAVIADGKKLINTDRSTLYVIDYESQRAWSKLSQGKVVYSCAAKGMPA